MLEDMLAVVENRDKGAVYYGSEVKARRRAMREAQEIVSGERQLIDSKYLWFYVLLVATGVGLFMLAVGWVLGVAFG